MSSQTNATALPPLRRTFPFLDLKAEFQDMRAEVMQAVEKVLESQYFILGPEVEALEREIATLTDCKYAVGCASGSDALVLALMALEIGRGDEVITTPFTFFASAGSIARVGAKPVFADIDPHTFNIFPQAIEKAITSRTRAIMPVHLFGLPADMSEIQEIGAARKLPVIEDAAQAIGARCEGHAVGSIGSIGCFSFFPSKNLGGAGDGGMLTTNDSALADRLRVLRVHGARKKYDHELLGINSRLDALQAAILRVKLRHLDSWTSARRTNASRYGDLFREFRLQNVLEIPEVPRGRTHVFNQFTIRVRERDELSAHLKQRGIPTEIYYPKALHLQRPFAYLGYKANEFPRSEEASLAVLSLPIYPKLKEEQQRSIVAAIADYYTE